MASLNLSPAFNGHLIVEVPVSGTKIVTSKESSVQADIKALQTLMDGVNNRHSLGKDTIVIERNDQREALYVSNMIDGVKIQSDRGGGESKASLLLTESNTDPICHTLLNRFKNIVGFAPIASQYADKAEEHLMKTIGLDVDA